MPGFYQKLNIFRVDCADTPKSSSQFVGQHVCKVPLKHLPQANRLIQEDVSFFLSCTPKYKLVWGWNLNICVRAKF